MSPNELYSTVTQTTNLHYYRRSNYVSCFVFSTNWLIKSEVQTLNFFLIKDPNSPRHPRHKQPSGTPSHAGNYNSQHSGNKRPTSLDIGRAFLSFLSKLPLAPTVSGLLHTRHHIGLTQTTRSPLTFTCKRLLLRTEPDRLTPC